jgi:amidohydrolase
MRMDRTRELDELEVLRHELHEHAELAGEEVETSRIIRRFLEPFEPTQLVTEIAGTGLAVVFEGPERGPSLMVRAELDAVPIEEASDVDYRSCRSGVCHACGHDGHAAIVAGLAAELRRLGLRRGRLILLFQPAEETGAGARRVIDDPRFEAIAPDWIFALHNLPGENFGEIQIRSGAFTAGSEGMVLRLRGRTSHAAYPEQGRSPALAVADLIRDLVALPGGLESADGMAKLTVIHARIGQPAFGTTPGEAEVMATARSDREDLLDRLRRGAVERARKTADRYGLEFDASRTDRFPVTTNHPEAVAVVKRSAEAAGLAVNSQNRAYPWSEDFGWYTRRFKGALFGLGAGPEAPALHSPQYDFPDDLIPLGVSLFSGMIREILG